MMPPGLTGFALLAIGLAGLEPARADSVFSARAPERIFLEARKDGGSDFQRFQDAMDSLASMGGEILLGAGLFNLQGPGASLDCRQCRGITLRGSGDKTIVKTDAGPVGRAAVFRFIDSDSVLVEELAMEGSFLPETDWKDNAVYHGGLLFSACKNVTVRNCRFRGFYTGAVLFQSGSSGFSVSNCYFDRVSYKMKGDYGAIAVESGSFGGAVEDNAFSRVTHSAISAYGSRDLRIIRNHAGFLHSSRYTMGFFAVEGISGSVISRNRFLGAYNEAIMLEGGEAGVLGNRVEGNDLAGRFAGISVNEARNACAGRQADGNEIIGNRIRSPESGRASHGILINHGLATRIRSNDVSGTVCGINLQYCSSENDIDSNSLSSTETGINFAGNGRIGGNRFRKVGVGMKVPARSRAIILGNGYTEVRIRKRTTD